MKNIHRITGIITSIFILSHLINHSMAWFGIEQHQKCLDTLRQVYRIPFIEGILIGCFLFQIFSGIKLLLTLRKKKDKNTYEKIQYYTGLAIAYFLIQHIPATIGQRLIYGFDTNFYFAAKVVNEKPWLYYFVPYYIMGVMAIGIHIANIHRHKISPKIGIKNATIHFYLITVFFALLTFIILFSLMGGRYDFSIPKDYNVF